MKKITSLLVVLLISSGLRAQLSGTYNIPSDYPTLGAAIISLNTQGVSGPVTINVPAGYTETITATYTLTATGTVANPIIFQKSGAGANPLITAHTGTATPASAVQDGIWALIGSDYVTIEGIDLYDPNTSNPASMEYGYGLFRASAGDGCQNVTIKNCVVTLNRVNNVGGTAPAVDGSRGINSVSSLYTTQTTITTPTAAAGTNSNNRFYSNTIQNCNIGIALIGYAASSPFTLGDTGNDIGGSSASTGNSILNFGGGATTSPAAAIRTLAQYSVNISYNTINNNNGSGVNHATTLRGIFINTATSASSSINSNTITLSSGATTSALTAIDNAAGATAASNAVNINNNLITNCSYTTATSGVFTGISNSASSATLNVNNNTFSNNSTNATSGTYYNILNSGSVTSQINISNNTVSALTFSAASSSAAINNISISGSGSSAVVTVNNNSFQNFNTNTVTGALSCIFNSSVPSSININSNYIGNITLGGSATHTLIETGSPSGTAAVNSNTITGIACSATSGTLRLIKFTSPATSITTNSNVIDGAAYTTLSSTGNIDCIYGLNSSTNFTANNNIIRNIAVPASGTINGIREWGTTGNKVVQGNAISNFSCTAGGTGGGTFNGIFCSTGTMTISSNSVSGFNSNGATGVTMNGINISGGTASSIYRNKIYDLSATTGTAVTISGILLSGGSSNTAYNNLIGSLTAPSAIGANAIIGINITGGTTDNIYYNTVNLNATSTSTLSGSSAISVNATPTTIALRNNIFVNNSAATGTGLSVAFRKSTTSLTNYSTASNNNLFYAGTPAANKLIFYDGTNSVQTLAAYKTLMSTRDGVSVTENPTFVSTTGSNSNFLNINTSVPTQIESGAAAISGITDDYAGTVRNVSTPDIGAWEGNYVLGDLAPPVFTGGSVSYGCSATAATYTINIADNSGVATGSLSPRVYYKVNAGAYTSVQGTLASGTATNGVWSFNLTYAGNSGDVVSYYTVAQDAVSNLGASPAAGFAGTDVNTVTTAPTTPLTYLLGGTLNGTYNVGAGQTFTTLTQAAQVYNIACLSGPVTFALTDATYSTSETFPISFLNNTTASSTNSLLIKPAAGITSTITGSNATAIIRFTGADFIKLDGSNNATTSKNLSIENTGTTSSAVIWIGNSSASDAASNISINNSNISGSSSANTTVGVALTSGITMGSAAEISNNTMTISGNSFIKSQNAVYASGNATTPDLNWTITDNTIGSATAANKMGYRGIAVVNAQSFTVATNTIKGVTTNGSSATAGILIAGNSGNGTVTANVISDIKNTSSSGYGSSGISIASTNTTSSIYVTNNFIFDVASYGYSSGVDVNDNGYGMVVSSGGGYKIYHNTVLLNTNQTTGVPASINITSAVTTAGAIDLRNNIFANTQTVSNGYAIYSGAANTVFSSIDYNDYSTSSANLAYIGSARANLAALRTGFGSNLNSVSVVPVFTSATDLHLIPLSNMGLNNLGTPVGVTIDIDNQTRSLTTPDMGADEFDVPACTSANGGTITPSSYALCAGQSLTLTSVGTSTGSTTGFQWQVSATSGGTYANVTGGTGATTTSYTSTALTAGTYYMVLQATCAAASVTAISNEVTVTVNAIPTASASATPTLICAGDNLSLSGSSNIGTSFTWSGPNSFSANTQNPVINGASALATGNYTVLASANSCTSAPAVVAVSVSTPPTAITVTPSSAALCSGNSQTLSVTGGLVPKTFNFGTQANQNTGVVAATDYPAPYSLYYGGQRMQMMILASELTAAGFTAGSQLSSLQFPVVSRGSNWPGKNLQNFQVNIGHTNLSTMTAFQTGLTNVQAPVSFTPVVGYTNTHTFSSAFVWDGTSNVIIETTFSNNASGTANDLVVQYNSPTSFTSTIVYRVDSSPAATVAGATSITYSYSKRPDFKLNGVAMGTYAWSPSEGLSATSGTSVVASPTTTTVYTVTTASGACSVSNSSTVNVTPTPTVDIATTSASVCAGNTATLTASGATTYSWSTASTNAIIAVSPTAAANYTLTGFNGSCSGTKTITIDVNTPPTVSISSASLTLCDGQSATLMASGADTYSWSTTSTNTTVVVSPTTTTVYSVTGTSPEGCEATALTTVTVNPAPALSVNSATICEGSSAIITPSGADTYTITGGTFTVSPSSTTSYSVTGTSAEGCVSDNDAVSTISVNAAPVITVNNPTVCEGTSAVITPSGADTYSITGNTFTVTPSATDSYTVTGTDVNGCVSLTDAVSTVSVNTLPVITVNNPSVCDGVPAIITAAGADTYTITGGTFTVTPSSTTSYSVTGTDANGCVSADPAVSTVSVSTSPVIAVSSATICEGTSVTIVPTGADTYTITGNTFTVSPSVTTSYSVTGTSAEGCESSNTAVSTVSVNASPSLTVATTNTLLCSGETATLTVSGADTYTWSSGSNTNEEIVSPVSTTVYTVTGADAITGCESVETISQDVTICTGILQAQSSTFFNLYPNPNNGEFVLEAPENTGVVITNAIGQVVYSTKTSSVKTAISLTEFADGVYFVKATLGNSQQMVKIVKH